jgi:hypothetical protein
MMLASDQLSADSGQWQQTADGARRVRATAPPSVPREREEARDAARRRREGLLPVVEG